MENSNQFNDYAQIIICESTIAFWGIFVVVVIGRRQVPSLRLIWIFPFIHCIEILDMTGTFSVNPSNPDRITKWGDAQRCFRDSFGWCGARPNESVNVGALWFQSPWPLIWIFEYWIKSLGRGRKAEEEREKREGERGRENPEEFVTPLLSLPLPPPASPFHAPIDPWVKVVDDIRWSKKRKGREERKRWWRPRERGGNKIRRNGAEPTATGSGLHEDHMSSGHPPTHRPTRRSTRSPWGQTKEHRFNLRVGWILLGFFLLLSSSFSSSSSSSSVSSVSSVSSTLSTFLRTISGSMWRNLNDFRASGRHFQWISTGGRGEGADWSTGNHVIEASPVAHVMGLKPHSHSQKRRNPAIFYKSMIRKIPINTVVELPPQNPH